MSARTGRYRAEGLVSRVESALIPWDNWYSVADFVTALADCLSGSRRITEKALYISGLVAR